MQPVGIITDTSACLPQDLIYKYSIEVVPLQFVINGSSYLDGIDISPAQFYAMLPGLRKLPTTSPSSPGRYLQAFNEVAKHCVDLLCITLSKNFSGMFDAANEAAELAKQSFEKAKIEILDSGTAAGAHGLVVLEAARAAASGKNLHHVIEIARSIMSRVHLVAIIDTLHYLAKGGRVPQVAAWAGSILGIKPIIHLIPQKAEVKLVARVRTKQRAVDSMLAEVGKLSEGRFLHAIVQHSNVPDEAQELKNRISTEFDCAELYVKDFTPTMGIHTGPGLLAVAFYAGG